MIIYAKFETGFCHANCHTVNIENPKNNDFYIYFLFKNSPDYGMVNQIAKEDPVIVQRYLPDPFLINGYKEDDQIVKQGTFYGFFSLYFIQHCFICRPSDSTVSEDAGIKPRTYATSASVS
jgi:hypothetical protein